MRRGHWAQRGDKVWYAMAFLLSQLGVPAVAQDAPAAGIPTFKGKHEVSNAVGQAGARLELESGFSILLPPGLPIGSSRLLTLSVAKQRVSSAEVAPEFIPIGPSVVFDGVIHAGDSPLSITYEARRFAVRAGHRVVLAVEHRGFCDQPGAGRDLGGGLCAHFRLDEARHDEAAGLVVAQLADPGGMRLQFGSVPNAAPEAQ